MVSIGEHANRAPRALAAEHRAMRASRHRGASWQVESPLGPDTEHAKRAAWVMTRDRDSLTPPALDLRMSSRSLLGARPMTTLQTLALLNCLCLATSAAGQPPQALHAEHRVVFRRVLLEGDPAPGMPGLAFGEVGAPAAFGALAALPSIDESGNLGIHAFAGPDPTMFS